MFQQLQHFKDTLVAEVGYILLLLLPSAAVILTFYRRQKKEKLEAKAPFDQLPRRPAGESNRLEIERLTEEIDPWVLGVAVVPVLIAIVLTLQKPSLPLIILCFLLCAVFCAVAQRKLGPLTKERAAYRLGFQGERYVAEELNQLMADGFRVFHDVPFEKYNVDHVLVGPNGVFVVETKTRRKRTADGKEKHKVLFDGARLNFPGGRWDTEALDQARLNAKTLAQYLSSATADRITAHPILTIPGWLVERSIPQSNIYVTNPKLIRSFVLNFNEKALTPAEIQRSAHQLEEKCKLAVD